MGDRYQDGQIDRPLEAEQPYSSSFRQKAVDTFRDLEQNPKSSGPCFQGWGGSADLCLRMEIARNPASAIV